MALMASVEAKDIKNYRQVSFPIESGFYMEPKQPKFIIIPLTDLARVIATDNPAFLKIQEQRKEAKLPREYDPAELNGKAVHATFSLVLFLDRYPITKRTSPKEHIQKIVEEKFPYHFPSLKNIQLETTSKFLIETGENIWFRVGETGEKRETKIAYLFEQVRTALFNQENHEEYIFGQESPPQRYNQIWLNTWEAFGHNGFLSLKHLDKFFNNHLSKFKIHGSGIFSELAVIQRFYNDRSGKILNTQVNGRPDLIVAIAGINPQTGRFQFSHWQVYDFKNKLRRYRETEEHKVDRTQLWLNVRALSRTPYQVLQQRKEGKAVSIEGAVSATIPIPVEGYLIYARENSDYSMIEKVEFSREEEKTNEHRLYRWMRKFRKDKGVFI